MRRLLLAATLALCAAAPAGAHPGHGAESVSVDGTGLGFNPTTVTVATGESVVWFWNGATFNHSVTADPGQAESFDSDPDGIPDHTGDDSFSHQFTHEGTFTYHCRVHATMRGEVVVVKLGGGGSGPFRFKAVSADVRRNHVEIRFRLTAAGDLAARIAERSKHRWNNVKTFNRRVRKGANRLELPLRGLDPGRHRLTLTAYDSADRRTEAREVFFLPR